MMSVAAASGPRIWFRRELHFWRPRSEDVCRFRASERGHD